MPQLRERGRRGHRLASAVSLPYAGLASDGVQADVACRSTSGLGRRRQKTREVRCWKPANGRMDTSSRLVG